MVNYRFRDKIIEQNTDRKFSEGFTRMHARVNIRVCQIGADSNSSFMRTTQATMLLFLNITKNADTWQNEVPMNQSSLIFFLVQIAEIQILKLFSRQSAFYQTLILSVFTLCFVWFCCRIALQNKRFSSFTETQLKLT